MSIIETDGIVTREIKYGDSSRILTVITKELGKISVLAGGARSNRSGLLAATQLFSYVSFTLFKSRDKSLYKINNAEIVTSFSSIRNSLDKMAYASYFCDIANNIVQEGAPDEKQLALLLNTLYILDSDKLSYLQIKAIYEFRSLFLQGLLPNLTICSGCGKNGDTVYFDPINMTSYCMNCGEKNPENLIKTGGGILDAISYIACAEPKKIFAFRLSAEGIKYLSHLGEFCMELGLEKHLKTLDYLKKIQELEGA